MRRDDGSEIINNVHLYSIGKDKLSSDDISILQKLEKQNKINYQDSYVSEFLKCRNNILYFIHNYCCISEVGNPRLYTPDMMNRKYRRVIKSINRYNKAILMASRQLGKALDLNTLVLRPDGSFTQLKHLKVGDYIVDREGKKTQIIAESEIFLNKKTYQILFSNDEVVNVSDDHLWNIKINSIQNDEKILNTQKIYELFHQKNKCVIKKNQYIIFNINKNESLAYLQGLFMISGKYLNNKFYLFCDKNKKKIILSLLKKNKIQTDNLIYDEQNELLDISVFKKKLKNVYKTNILSLSKRHRIYFIRAIFDLKGQISTKNIYIKSLSKYQEKILKKVLSSLGINYQKKSNNLYVYTRKFYLFSTKDKQIKQKKIEIDEEKCNYVQIKDIKEIDSKPSKCLMVDSPSKTFMITNSMIPTHNSTLASCIIAHALTFYPGIKVVMFNMDQPAGTENINKVRYVLENLPDWMRFIPKKSTTKTFIDMTNESTVSVCYPSTIKSPDQLARSLTIPCLYVDEAAFIRHIDRIWMSAQPTLSTASEQAKKYGYPTWSILTSTVRHVLLLNKQSSSIFI